AAVERREITDGIMAGQGEPVERMRAGMQLHKVFPQIARASHGAVAGGEINISAVVSHQSVARLPHTAPIAAGGSDKGPNLGEIRSAGLQNPSMPAGIVAGQRAEAEIDRPIVEEQGGAAEFQVLIEMNAADIGGNAHRAWRA